MIKQQSENYLSIFNNLDEIIVIWNEAGQILDLNPAACTFFNSTTDAILSLGIEQLEVLDAASNRQALITTLLKSGKASYHIHHYADPGSPRKTEVKACRIDWNGQPAFCSLYRPLPGDDAALELPGTSEERLRAITNSTKDAILMMDEQGTLSFWNPAAEKIFGYTTSEAIGNNLHKFLAPPRYHHEHVKAFQVFQQTGEGKAINKTLELEAIHKDGHEISIELSLSRLNIRGAWHTIGIIRDITERKKAEKELKESEERFRVLHNASFGGIAIHDNGLILDCNQGLSELTGYSFDELVGMDGTLLIAPNWRSFVIDKIKSGYEGTYDVEGLRKDGSTFPVSIRGCNIPYKGKLARVTEFRDSSERKQAEEKRKELEAQLVQAQKMEAIGTLAGGIAHDFNNILGAILGYVELSRTVVPSSSPAAGFLDKALKGVRRATQLVSRILSFSRQQESERVPVHVPPLVKEALKLLRPLLPTTINIRQEIDDDVPSILADPTQIHQILMNLCTNAFHAMEITGGTITIRLQALDLTAADLQQHQNCEAGQYLVLTVEDSGPGIPENIQDKIFEPYFTTKSVGKGSGMGLSIVHGIVQNYRGFINVSSEPGQGTTFDLYLPTITGTVQPVKEESHPIPQGSEKILLVDDEELVADTARSMLEHLGYQVTALTDSLEAFNLFKKEPVSFDLVITDQTMPVMTGIDLAQRLIEIRHDIPIIICTGFSSTISEDQALAKGIRGFAYKPLAIHDVAVMIRNILDKQPS